MILISEVAGAGRWSQFSLLLEWVQPFFGRPYTQNSTVILWSVDAAGNLTARYDTEVFYKPESSNWAFEIPGASDLPWPAVDRPILAMKQRGGNDFSFDLVMPDEGRYAAIAGFLDANNQAPAHAGRLRRTMLADQIVQPIIGLMSL